MALVNATLSTTATAVPSVSKLPSKRFASISVTNLVVGVIMFGADVLDVIESKRNWFIKDFGGFTVKFGERIRFKVKGRPGG